MHTFVLTRHCDPLPDYRAANRHACNPPQPCSHEPSRAHAAQEQPPRAALRHSILTDAGRATGKEVEGAAAAQTAATAAAAAALGVSASESASTPAVRVAAVRVGGHTVSTRVGQQLAHPPNSTPRGRQAGVPASRDMCMCMCMC